MLASLLVEGWTNTDEQKVALKSAVGLLPADDFWGRLGNSTSKLSPRDKIYFLARMISYIGSQNQVSGLIQAIPETLSEIQEYILMRNPDLAEADGQLLAAEFIVCDYLLAGQSPDKIKSRILSYIGSSDSVVTALLGTLEGLKKRWALPDVVPVASEESGVTEAEVLSTMTS